MSKSTVLTLASGKGVDLLDPTADDIDFAVIAEHLAKVKRFNGATAGFEYSVAEHCVRGCDHILRDRADQVWAAYFLLHDAHEAFLGDDTTPKKRLIASIASQSFGALADHVMAAFELATYRFDKAIHDAAGLAFPPDAAMQASIKTTDKRMFVTEWRDLMGDREHPDPSPYDDLAPYKMPIDPWPWVKARDEYIQRCFVLLPKLKKTVTPFRKMVALV